MLTRRDLILARYHGVAVEIPVEEEMDTLAGPGPDSVTVRSPTVDTAEDTLTARRIDAQWDTADSQPDNPP
jgi:hypothetical protein